MKAARLALLAPLLLAGCSPTGMAVGAAATAGVVVAQEREVDDAVTDFAIKAQVNDLLFRADERLFVAVSTDVVEGRVMLTGQVPTAEDRVEAVRLAWQADGVREVLNELQVTDKGGLDDYLLDVRISTDLRTRILLDRDVQAINYNVETVNGTIYLIGIAQDAAELERVMAHARTIPYVERIVSHVRLKAGPPAS